MHSCAEPSAEELDEQEMTFLEDMYQLMQAAHFRLLSADDWKTAQAEQFTVRLWQHPTHGCLVICGSSGISTRCGVSSSELLH